MRITWSLPVGGERLHGARGDLVRASGLVEALRRDGHEVRVVESMDRPVAEAAVKAYRNWVRRALPRRAALVLRDVGRWMDTRDHGARVAAAARAQPADLIVETQVHAGTSAAVAAGLTGLPLLLDDCSPLSEAVALGLGLPALVRRALGRQVEAARWITVSSEALVERMVLAGVPSAKLHVVPNGVDPTAYEHVDRDAERRRLGLEGRCVVAFLGSFQPWHRVELLVQALAPLADERPVHLLLIGDGPGRPRALAEADRLGLSSRVLALGAVAPARVPALIAACDIGGLSASNDYGHPMKLLDYAAAGLPAVAPDLAPVREVVQDGVTALLFPPGDVQALSRALARLVADDTLRRRLGSRAREDVAAKASWRARARSLVSLLERDAGHTTCDPSRILQTRDGRLG
jgi:glycosyltransferase involved in cell wall biosynthesis